MRLIATIMLSLWLLKTITKTVRNINLDKNIEAKRNNLVDIDKFLNSKKARLCILHNVCFYVLLCIFVVAHLAITGLSTL